jgi:Ca2+-binding RTX toxin-like protein
MQSAGATNARESRFMSSGNSAQHRHLIESLENRAYFSDFAPVIAPSNLTVTATSSTTVRLMWNDNSPNEQNFFIFRSTDDVNFAKVITTPADAVSWIDQSLTPGTTYFYRMKAHALTANSGYSNIDSATTPATDPFAKLDATTGQLNVMGTPDDDNISLSVVGANLNVKENGVTLSFVQANVNRISIFGIAGDDKIVINAGVGAAYISGGDGNDTLIGNTGDDRIDGGAGDDSIKGEDGNDTLTGGDGNDTIYGQAGDDDLEGGNGNDKIVGGDGNDSITGDAGNDRLYGQLGFDTIEGGSGSNFIVPD